MYFMFNIPGGPEATEPESSVTSVTGFGYFSATPYLILKYLNSLEFTW